MLLSYTTEGEGRPLVFLHGFLESSKIWVNFTLSEKYKKIYMDLPGHGDSNLRCDAIPSIEYMASLVYDTLLNNSIYEFDIIGHSMGGYVALCLLEKFNINGKVVLLNSNFFEDTEQKMNDRLRVIDVVKRNKIFFINESIPNLFFNQKIFSFEIESLKENASSISVEAIEFACIAMMKRACKKKLCLDNRNKVLVIQGEKDSIISVDKMKIECEDKIQLKIIPNTGHLSHIESPANVLSELESFLS